MWPSCPQWELLNFLSEKAQQYPGFRLLRSTEATGLLVEDNLAAGLEVVDDQAPLDVLWFRVSKTGPAHIPFVSIRGGFLLVCVDRGSYWQMAYGIPVDSEQMVRSRGLKALEHDIALVDEGLAARFRAGSHRLG